MSLESAFSIVEKLVKDFKTNERHYLAPDYSESQARLDFIDKFFVALGWDVGHIEQKNPYEQEVKVERIVRDKDAQKRADYAFFLKPNYRDPKFYVEAKKPSRSLGNPADYFQAIRYGWNAQTPLVVLTDFEELHIIDSRFKPNIKTASSQKVKSYHYTDYTDKEKFAELYYLFSREAVETGSIEKFAETMPKPKGKARQKGLFAGAYQSIDESFLEELDEIRNTLARSFKKSNPGLTSEELTEATQRTIDRLVFIRFLEDMLIEPEHHISSYGDKGTAWGDFIHDSRSLNAKYNGVVFKEHFIDRPPFDKGGQSVPKVREGGSAFNPPEDKDFAEICEDLSHINSPYNFNTIPIHILGSIYERFLGKVVHATEKRVTIEEKPEVRKAGGVYYTPQYIVQYIVENTVGKLIEGKTPKEIAKLRFADISCGSGSFLITVYDTLLRYHSKWYQQHTKEAKDAGCLLSDGLWVLSLRQKREILLNNVYGVDIDSQAVEVTQLSLYLKLLEDETLATANEMQALFKEKILPDLSKNIICGNSLIGTDIYEGNMFPGEEERKINAMNFEDAFPEIMRGGGFDAIVGNPPYVKARDYNKEKDFYRGYLNSSNYYETLYLMWDLYIPFLEKGTKIIKKNGMLGYIIPDTLEKSTYAKLMREYLVNNFHVPQIDFFPDSYIFKSNNKVIGVKNIVLFISRGIGNSTNKIIHDKDITLIKANVNVQYDVNIFTISNSLVNFNKSKRFTLGDICMTSYGLRLNSDKNDKKFKFKKTDLLSDVKNERCWKGFTEGKFVSRYKINKVRFLEWDSERCPTKLVRPTFRELYQPVKLLLGRQTKVAAYDSEGIIVDNTIIICTLHKNFENVDNSNIRKYYNNITNKNRKELIEISKNYDLKFILGIVNSLMIKYFLKTLTKDTIDVFPDDWKKIPIPDVGSMGQSKMVSLVDQMIEAKKQLATAKTDKDKNFYESKCNSLDRQIDRLVYELYGLTEEEIKVVEGG